MTYDVCSGILNKYREEFYKYIKILPKEIYHYTSSNALLSIIHKINNYGLQIHDF